MKRHHPQLIAAGLCTILLVACIGADTPPAPDEATQAEATAASDQPAEPAIPAPAPAEPPSDTAPAITFAAAPAKGWIIRSNCRMGGCSWYRYEVVERTGGNDAPNYNLQLMPGESSHPQDPYPTRPDGVDIRWQSAAATAEVMCSQTTPYAAVEDHGERLSLNAEGVPGAAQGLANLYFATCHGEYGDDAQLAKKFGYDLR